MLRPMNSLHNLINDMVCAGQVYIDRTAGGQYICSFIRRSQAQFGSCVAEAVEATPSLAIERCHFMARQAGFL